MSQNLLKPEHEHQQAKIVLWSQRILDCKNSGKTVPAWCAENNINEKSYWRWHRELKLMYKSQTEDHENHEPEFFEITPPVSVKSSTEVIAAVHINQHKVDILSSDVAVITNIFRALKQC